MRTSTSNDNPSGSKPVVVKKYANRRLYNTATSSYVTLDDLAQMIKEGGDFVAHDAKTGEDITRSVLTQIIVEQEQKGQNLLPISFLRQLISLYGDSMQFLVPGYLEQAMITFARNQEQMRKNLQATFGVFPFGQLERKHPPHSVVRCEHTRWRSGVAKHYDDGSLTPKPKLEFMLAPNEKLLGPVESMHKLDAWQKIEQFRHFVGRLRFEWLTVQRVTLRASID